MTSLHGGPADNLDKKATKKHCFTKFMSVVVVIVIVLIFVSVAVVIVIVLRSW